MSLPLNGEILKRLSELVVELASLLGAAEKTESGTGALLIEKSLRELAPPERALLLRAFEGSVREMILKGILDTCGDQADSAIREQISDSDLASFILRLFRQMTNIEDAIVPIAAEIKNDAQKNKLPGHAANLKGYTLQLVRNGGIDAVEKINDYLGDINRWIAAILYGWTKAPEEWWRKWYEKLAPRSIKKEVPQGFFLTNKYWKYWKHYEEQISDLNPALVKLLLNDISKELARKKM